MGHTIGEWRAKVAELIRDVGGRDVGPLQIETVGLRPAFVEYSSRRPYVVQREAAGTGSPYVALPAGWVEGESELLEVEYPARRNPVSLLDRSAWRMVRSAADVNASQLLLGYTPGTSEWVRLIFTAPWPFPTDDDAVDKITNAGFEAVSSLAASRCLTSLAAEAARSLAGGVSSDFVAGEDRSATLIRAAEQYRASYEAMVKTAPSVF